jgi:tetratricopeptide (TPR) repeat protein
MAATKKISRKEIKQPDEFLTLSARGIEFAKQHTRELIIGAACVLAIGLLFWAASARSEKRETKASHMLAQALALLNPEPGETQSGQAAPGEVRADAENQAKAVALLQDVVDHYKRTEAAGPARILLGQHDYDSGNYDAAIDCYQDFLKMRNRKPELTAMAYEGLGYSYEAKGDFSQALSNYENVKETHLANVQGWAYLGMARCYEKLGELQKAVDTYRTFLADYPRHPKAAEARANMARITQLLEERGSTEAAPPAEPKEAQNPETGKPE